MLKGLREDDIAVLAQAYPVLSKVITQCLLTRTKHKTSPVDLVIIICNNLILGNFHHITMVCRKVLTKIKGTKLEYTPVKWPARRPDTEIKFIIIIKNVDDKVIHFEFRRGPLC